MNRLATASVIALAAAALPLAAGAQTPPGSFRLPTPTPTPTDIQGPVDPDAPILTRPRDTAPTPTPRATPPAPTPTPTAARPIVTPTPRPVASPRNSSLPPRFTPPAAPVASDTAPVTPSDAPFPTPGEIASDPLPAPLPTAAAPSAPATTEPDGGQEWLYALGGALLAAIGIGAALFFRRRRREDEPVATIAPPRAGPIPGPVPEPPLAAVGAPLMIEARAVRLARSMLNATLSYELHVTNRGGAPLHDVRFGADLVTAHARIPTEQQLADPALPLSTVKQIERLDPGESAQFSGELRLPVNQIRPIPHGKAVVYVPLLRVRAEAMDISPVARTFVVGLVPSGTASRLQPFRLDEMPQTYHAVGQRALD